MPGGDDRIGRQPIGLGLVHQQEERPESTDAVVWVMAVEPGVGMAAIVQLTLACRSTFKELVQLAELDRVRGASLGTGRLHIVLQPVVAERALPHTTVLLALVEHTEGARDHAVTTAVEDVLLYDDRPELGAEKGTRWTDIEAAGLGAVLADVRAHEPPEARLVVVSVEPV